MSAAAVCGRRRAATDEQVAAAARASGSVRAKLAAEAGGHQQSRGALDTSLGPLQPTGAAPRSKSFSASPQQLLEVRQRRLCRPPYISAAGARAAHACCGCCTRRSCCSRAGHAGSARESESVQLDRSLAADMIARERGRESEEAAWIRAVGLSDVFRLCMRITQGARRRGLKNGTQPATGSPGCIRRGAPVCRATCVHHQQCRRQRPVYSQTSEPGTAAHHHSAPPASQRHDHHRMACTNTQARLS